MTATLNLPAIDPVEAEMRRVVVAALSGVRIGAAVLAARIERAPDRRGGWLNFENGSAIAIDRLDGSPLRLDGDPILAATQVERAEPLIAAIEAALGLSLTPDALSDAPPEGLIVTVEQGTVARLRLALPVDLPLLPARPDFAAGLVGGVMLPMTLSVEGPRIAPHDAASLEPGDLLLVGGAPLPARLAIAGRSIAGRYDAATQRFHIHSIGAS